MKYAMVKQDGTIISILTVQTDDQLILNTPSDTTAIEFDNSSSDPNLFAYDWANNEFKAITPPTVLVESIGFTFNQWVDLFSMPEQLAIVEGTMTDPMTKLIYDRAMSASGTIDKTDPRTISALQYLVFKGYVEQDTYDGIIGDA